MIRCSRCGRETHIEYGADGQAYCNSCIFYGLNKPCFKCRMYLPTSELQQYKGQWMCPYCLMDSRDEDRRIEGRGEDQLKGYQVHEQCERCGRALSIVYYYRGLKLCDSCVDEAKREWKDVGGERPPMSMYRITQGKERESKKLSFFESLFANILGRIGIKTRKKMKESEVVALRMKKKTAFVPFAKPMKEESIVPFKKEEKEEIVAIKKKEKKKGKGKKKSKKEKKKSKKEKEEEKEKKKEKFGQYKSD
jgi:hypothetical protein